MFAAVLRLTIIVALAMMPLGMASAPAAAGAIDHHSLAMSDHCPQPSGQDDSAPGKAMDCKVSCSALPASSARPADKPIRPPIPWDTLAASDFDGTIPEIATPPPRLG